MGLFSRWRHHGDTMATPRCRHLNHTIEENFNDFQWRVNDLLIGGRSSGKGGERTVDKVGENERESNDFLICTQDKNQRESLGNLDGL